jgi:pyruvate dehydrogenase (quinone)
MAKLKVADIIIDALQSAGAKRCYGVVGDTLNQITDAIRRRGMECGTSGSESIFFLG